MQQVSEALASVVVLLIERGFVQLTTRYLEYRHTPTDTISI